MRKEEPTPPVPDSVIKQRRETSFLVLSGLFLGSLTMLNILGTSRFLDLTFTVFGTEIPMPLAIGVLPYPITFLCTDFISEIFGEKKANQVVWMGLALNGWVLIILWLGGIVPGFESPEAEAFMTIRKLALGATVASMIAYMIAQFCDVRLFHYWKRLTGGKHLWLRNNGSTLISQWVDTVAVILITHYYANGLPIDENAPIAGQLMTFILSGYVFKVLCALVDTIPFYFGVAWFRRYLALDANEEVG
jgi:uncharacterized integral membrane protein (TIGR00697 family)